MSDNNLPTEDMAPEPYPYDHVRESMTFPSEELLRGVFDDKNKDVSEFIAFSKFQERTAELIIAPDGRYKGYLLKVSSQAFMSFFGRFLWIKEEKPCDIPRPPLAMFHAYQGTSWERSWLFDQMKHRYDDAKRTPTLFFAITDNVANFEHTLQKNKGRRFNVGTIHPDAKYECKLPHPNDVIIIWLGPKLELPQAPPPPPRFDPDSEAAKRVMDPMYGMHLLPLKDVAGLFHGVDTEAMDRDVLSTAPTEILWEPSPEDITTDNEYGEVRMKEGIDQFGSAMEYLHAEGREYL